MNQPDITAANSSSQHLLTLAMRVAMPLLVVAANTVGAASARAQELRAPSAVTPPGYDDAVHALTAQRYSAAYDRFAALADKGHAPSALMALAMVRYRPSLSGPPWSATSAQLQRWSALVAHEEREPSRLIAEVNHRE